MSFRGPATPVESHAFSKSRNVGVYWVFFFFSSRRRHTRCSRDWSSDVCSSDLIVVPQKKGEPIIIKYDESPREDTSMEALAKLKPAFKKDGTVTAGNAPGTNDGERKRGG